MAYNSDFTWAEEDGPNFYPPCLESYRAPEDGRQYVMYHGTSAKNARLILKNGFRRSKGGMFGPGVYVSRDLRKASRYPLELPISQKVVLEVLVNVGKVKKIDYQGHPLQKTWHQHGYDTAWCPPDCGMVLSGLEEDCIWDPKRIVIKQICPPRAQRAMSTVPIDGRQYVMYHGTSAKNARLILKNGFRRSKGGMFGPGVYVSRDLRKASRYPLELPISQKVVLEVLVNVGKVKKIDYQGHPLQKTWHQHGYDTAWCPPDCGMVLSGLEEDCIWDPKRIKVTQQICPVCDQGQWEFPECFGTME
ncbi:uncharacterized protein [Mobula birostris]|uniref:uncharacterized protein n=1 Tax=Mobula birostris TaxID=1983395 RepID=UPI003B27DDEE